MLRQGTTKFKFQQVDVFASQPLQGNPLAVVLGADELTGSEMAAFANWANLSETTFLLRPTAPDEPQALFVAWLKDAIEAGVTEPHAMTLSTVDEAGLSDARIFILPLI